MASIDGATTPPDADEDFFTRIADRLDAEAELVGDVADKVQALDSDPPEKPKALSKEHVILLLYDFFIEEARVTV